MYTRSEWPGVLDKRIVWRFLDRGLTLVLKDCCSMLYLDGDFRNFLMIKLLGLPVLRR